MPIEYSGTVAEHTAVRERVGLFDVSHMGKLRIHGPGAAAWFSTVVTNDFDRIGSGQAQYTLLCNDNGGVIDDLIAYRWSDDEIFCVPNAGNADEVLSVLQSRLPAGITIDNHQSDHCIIAVQGPASALLLDAAGLPSRLDYMAMVASDIDGHPVIVCRTGYTGEWGYEIVVPQEIAGQLWDDLLVLGRPYGVLPAGLGARDTLRTEMGYPLHGHELSPSITPLEAGVSWAVGWSKPEFGGRSALVAQKEAGPTRRTRALRALSRGIPRAGISVHGIGTDAGSLDGPVLGEVTSGTFSPTLKEGIALALLDSSVAVGDRVVLDVRGRALECEVVALPFVPSHVR